MFIFKFLNYFWEGSAIKELMTPTVRIVKQGKINVINPITLSPAVTIIPSIMKMTIQIFKEEEIN
jgi:hypothetical protein